MLVNPDPQTLRPTGFTAAQWEGAAPLLARASCPPSARVGLGVLSTIFLPTRPSIADEYAVNPPAGPPSHTLSEALTRPKLVPPSMGAPAASCPHPWGSGPVRMLRIKHALLAYPSPAHH